MNQGNHSMLLGSKPVAAHSMSMAWLMLSVATLGASTLFAILVASSRAPATAQLLGQFFPGHDFFHLALILHVTLGPLIFFLAFAMVLWSLALPKTALTNSGRAWNVLGWLGFALAALGATTLILVPVGSVLSSGTGVAVAVMSNYIPVLHSPLFLTGLALFGSGFALSLIRVLRWLRLGTLPLSERALGWGLLAAAVAGATALASGAWSAATLPANLEPTIFYEMLFWAPGHVLQSMHVLMMMVAWLVLADAAGIPLRSSTKVQGMLFLLALLPVLAAPLVHFAFPPDSTEFRTAFTELMRWAIWPGVVLLAADILYGLIRPNTPTLNKTLNVKTWTGATWGLVFSIVLLLTGLVIGAAINENNAVVPAHYHATTGAITLAYLGLALTLLSRLGTTSPRLHSGLAGVMSVSRWPVLAYGMGMLLMTGALAWAGYAGMTRKLPGSEKILEGFSLHLTLVAIGGTLVIIGGIGFVVIMLREWSRASTLPKWKTMLSFSLTGLIMALGIIFTLLPGSGAVPPAEKIDPHADPARHMQQVQTAEVSTRFQQGVAMLHAKQYEHAVTAFRRVLKLEPRLPEAHVNMGFAMLGLKDYATARNSFETAIDLRPAQANAYYGLALVLKAMKDTEGAIGTMRTYIHLSNPDDPYLDKARADLAAWETARGRKPGNDLPAVKPSQP